MPVKIVRESTFPAEEYAEELARGEHNLNIGTHLLHEDAKLRIWKISLAPGERTIFHKHQTEHWWTCITAGLCHQRTSDGMLITRQYEAGDTAHFQPTPDHYFIHDLENAGDTHFQVVTIELKNEANIDRATPSSKA